MHYLKFSSSFLKDIGYKFRQTDVSISDLAYADDLKLTTSTAEKNQAGLDTVDRFLNWTRTMSAKPRKCKSLGLKVWTSSDENEGRKRLDVEKRFGAFDPMLTLSGSPVGFIGLEHFKFLGWKVFHDLSETKQKEEIKTLFSKYMELADKSHVHGFMKIWLYQHYVLAYLSWELMIYSLM